MSDEGPRMPEPLPLSKEIYIDRIAELADAGRGYLGMKYSRSLQPQRDRADKDPAFARGFNPVRYTQIGQGEAIVRALNLLGQNVSTAVVSDAQSLQYENSRPMTTDEHNARFQQYKDLVRVPDNAEQFNRGIKRVVEEYKAAEIKVRATDIDDNSRLAYQGITKGYTEVLEKLDGAALTQAQADVTKLLREKGLI